MSLSLTILPCFAVNCVFYYTEDFMNNSPRLLLIMDSVSVHVSQSLSPPRLDAFALKHMKIAVSSSNFTL